MDYRRPILGLMQEAVPCVALTDAVRAAMRTLVEIPLRASKQGRRSQRRPGPASPQADRRWVHPLTIRGPHQALRSDGRSFRQKRPEATGTGTAGWGCRQKDLDQRAAVRMVRP